LDGTSLKKTTFLALLGILVVIAVLGVATYAWFTNNSKVETNTASGKSGVSNMALLIGSDEGNLVDTKYHEVEIPKVNESADISKMLPVSSADLETFMYCPATQGGKATKFIKDADEKRLFHGRIYMKMEGDNLSENDTYNIYLDTADSRGGSIAVEDSGHFLSASRLGLKVGENDPVIIKFEDGDAKSEDNTSVGGKDLGSGYVIDPSGNPVSDPSNELSLYTLNSSESTITFPEKVLAKIVGNAVVPVDVYFYLEGCDSNCIDDIQKNEAKFHLAFYAVAEQQQ